MEKVEVRFKHGIRQMSRACADIAIEHFGGYEIQPITTPPEIKAKLPKEITKPIPLKTEKVEEVKVIAPEIVKTTETVKATFEPLPEASNTEKVSEPVKKVRKTPVRSKSKAK
jgi:hypothetical protein